VFFMLNVIACMPPVIQARMMTLFLAPDCTGVQKIVDAFDKVSKSIQLLLLPVAGVSAVFFVVLLAGANWLPDMATNNKGVLMRVFATVTLAGLIPSFLSFLAGITGLPTCAPTAFAVPAVPVAIVAPAPAWAVAPAWMDINRSS